MSLNQPVKAIFLNNKWYRAEKEKKQYVYLHRNLWQVQTAFLFFFFLRSRVVVLTHGLLCCDHLGIVGELDDPVKDGGDG